MDFKKLDAYELLRCQNGTENEIRWPNGRLKFRRIDGLSDFYFDDGRKAAGLELIGSSALLGPTYALTTWYKNGERQLQATGYQGQMPTWYNLFREDGKRQAFVSKHLERHWDVHGNTIVCKALVNGEWNNLLALAKQVNPNSSQQTLNKVINELIYTMRGNSMLPPYESEYEYKARKKYMMKLHMETKKSR